MRPGHGKQVDGMEEWTTVISWRSSSLRGALRSSARSAKKREEGRDRDRDRSQGEPRERHAKVMPSATATLTSLACEGHPAN